MNDYVGAVYHEDKKVYVGKVLETDETDVHVSFLGHEGSLSTSSSFKIPKNPDEVWVQKDHILCIIPEPTGGWAKRKANKAYAGQVNLRNAGAIAQGLDKSWAKINDIIN